MLIETLGPDGKVRADENVPIVFAREDNVEDVTKQITLTRTFNGTSYSKIIRKNVNGEVIRIEALA